MQNEVNGLSHRRAYSIAEAAALVGCHRVTMHRLVQTGKLRQIAGFGRPKISAAELDRFLSQTADYEPSSSHVEGAAKRKAVTARAMLRRVQSTAKRRHFAGSVGGAQPVRGNATV
jgi:excisionase family DNA binding protein